MNNIHDSFEILQLFPDDSSKNCHHTTYINKYWDVLDELILKHRLFNSTYNIRFASVSACKRQNSNCIHPNFVSIYYFTVSLVLLSEIRFIVYDKWNTLKVGKNGTNNKIKSPVILVFETYKQQPELLRNQITNFCQ